MLMQHLMRLNGQLHCYMVPDAEVRPVNESDAVVVDSSVTLLRDSSQSADMYIATIDPLSVVVVPETGSVTTTLAGNVELQSEDSGVDEATMKLSVGKEQDFDSLVSYQVDSTHTVNTEGDWGSVVSETNSVYLDTPSVSILPLHLIWMVLVNLLPLQLKQSVFMGQISKPVAIAVEAECIHGADQGADCLALKQVDRSIGIELEGDSVPDLPGLGGGAESCARTVSGERNMKELTIEVDQANALNDVYASAGEANEVKEVWTEEVHSVSAQPLPESLGSSSVKPEVAVHQREDLVSPFFNEEKSEMPSAEWVEADIQGEEVGVEEGFSMFKGHSEERLLEGKMVRLSSDAGGIILISLSQIVEVLRRFDEEEFRLLLTARESAANANFRSAGISTNNAELQSSSLSVVPDYQFSDVLLDEQSELQMEFDCQHKQLLEEMSTASTLVSEVRGRNESLTEELAKYKSELQATVCAKDELEKQLHTAKAEVYRVENAILNGSLISAVEETKKLAEEKGYLALGNDELLTELSEFHVELKRSCGKLSSMSMELADCSDLVAGLQVENAILNGSLTSAVEETKKLAEEKGYLALGNEKLLTELSECKDSLASLQVENLNLSGSLALTTKDIINLEEVKENFVRENEKLSTDLAECKALLELLHEENANLNGSPHFDVKSLMESIKVEHLKAVDGLNDSILRLEQLTEENIKLSSRSVEDVNQLEGSDMPSRGLECAIAADDTPRLPRKGESELIYNLLRKPDAGLLYRSTAEELKLNVFDLSSGFVDLKGNLEEADKIIQKLENAIEGMHSHSVSVLEIPADAALGEFKFTYEALKEHNNTKKGELLAMYGALRQQSIVLEAEKSKLVKKLGDYQSRISELERQLDGMHSSSGSRIAVSVSAATTVIEDLREKLEASSKDHEAMCNTYEDMTEKFNDLHVKNELAIGVLHRIYGNLRKLINDSCGHVEQIQIIEANENLLDPLHHDNYDTLMEQLAVFLGERLQFKSVNSKLNSELIDKAKDMEGQIDHLCILIVQHENESLILKESMRQGAEHLVVVQSELHDKVNELEQSEQRKHLMNWRNASQELQLKDARLQEVETKLKTYSEAGERVEALESELSYIRNSATALRESFILKDSVLQRIEEILEDLELPEHFHSRDIIEKVDWLARSVTGNSLPLTDWDPKSSVRRGVILGYCCALWSQKIGLSGWGVHFQRLSNIVMLSGGRFYNFETYCDSLQQKVDNLETYCATLTDLEESQKRFSDLEAALQAVICEKEHLSESLDILTSDYDKVSEKAVQFEVDNDKLQNEVTALKDKLVEKVGNQDHIEHIEGEITRLKKLVSDVLQNSDTDDGVSGGSSTECLERMLRKLVEKYTTLSSEKPSLVYSVDEQTTEKAGAIPEDKRDSEGSEEQDLAVLKKELEDALHDLMQELQELLSQEEQKSVSVREKLNVAVRKGKSLVQQRDSLKQTIEEVNNEVERLKSEINNRESSLSDYELKIKHLSTYQERVGLLESESLFLKKRLAETEYSLHEKTHILSLILNALNDNDTGLVFNISDPVEKLEQIGNQWRDLHAAVASSENDIRKSKRAAELLLAELNEVQERNDGLQEELDFFDINDLLADILSKDLEYLHNLEVNMMSCLDPSEALNMVGQPLGGPRSITSANAENKETFLATSSLLDLKMQERIDDSNFVEIVILLGHQLQVFMKEIGYHKESLYKHLIALDEGAKHVSGVAGVVRREVTSQKQSCESMKENIIRLECIEKEKDTESIVMRRNISLLYEACSSSVMEIENWKSQFVGNDLAATDMGLNSGSSISLDGWKFFQSRKLKLLQVNYLQDFQSAKAQLYDSERWLEVMEEERNTLEQRMKELQDGEATLKDLDERVRSLNDVLAAKEQGVGASPLDDEETQMEELTNKIGELERVVQQKNVDMENLEASHGKVMKKLSVTVSKFDELHHLSASLLSEVEKLQSQLQERDTEISFLRQEVTRCTNDALVASQMSNKRNSDEIQDLLTWLDTMISGLQLHDVHFDDQKREQVHEYKEMFQKHIMCLVSELEDLREVVQSRDMLLQVERSKVEELTRKGESLENSLREKESSINRASESWGFWTDRKYDF
ncbi:hypothetical protein Acr_20g0000330 [Actinidia rufa]|uniref:Uncharacterized protein n=1 Tax=Actinidia rufa TaxID=165716 RepID=A0A7J0GBN4_9ERIC|nr:hypothetical protein Acr_20g0000330 [Actinidia rufa]